METIGELMAVLAALTGAVVSVTYNRLGQTTDSNILAHVRLLIAVPLMVGTALVIDGLPLRAFDAGSMIFLLISGVIGFFLTDMFMFRSYVCWGARETMVVMCLAPVLSGLLAFTFFNETLTPIKLLGTNCSIAGVVIMMLGDGKDMKRTISRGAIYAFVAAILQSVADMLAKYALSGTPWCTSSLIRAFGGLIIWLIYGFVKRKTFFVNAPKVFKPWFFLKLTVAVTIGTVIGTTAAMGALKYAPAGIVTSLKQMSPVFILLYELIFLKKKLSPMSILGTVISVFGVFLVF